MRIAVILHGSLRTFFMPLRDRASVRICDLIKANIAHHNNADVFLVTDSNDFYLDGKQHFNERERGEVEGNPRLSYDVAYHSSVGFMDHESAKSLLNNRLHEALDGHIKGMEIFDVIDVKSDPKYVMLCDSKMGGCTADRLVSQYIKIKRAGQLLEEHERRNGIRYDLVFRGRLDNKYGDVPLDIARHDYNSHDIFVPGIAENLFVYDWAAFGTRRAMDLSINLYDKLGYTMSHRLYRCECKSCKSVSCGPMTSCRCGGEMIFSEMTLAPEYHLFRIFLDNRIRCVKTNYPMSPYRYR